MAESYLSQRSMLGVLLVLASGCVDPTRESMGGIIYERPISWWDKTGGFISRSWKYQRWADEAVGDASDPKEKLVRLLKWTRHEVILQSPDVPYRERHISDVVERHSGKEKDQTEVFTTLATYSGFETSWQGAGPVNWSLSFVNSERGPMVFDVTNAGWFETPEGDVATIADLLLRPESLSLQGEVKEALKEGFLMGDTLPYESYFKRDLRPLCLKSETRARAQMFWYRLVKIIRNKKESGSLQDLGLTDRCQIRSMPSLG